MLTPEEVLARFDNQPSRETSLTEEERNTLDRAVESAINAIAVCATWHDAENGLFTLGQVQDVLATLSFKYEVPLSEKQRRIVREYDRWDVPDVRHAVYDAIRRHRFP